MGEKAQCGMTTPEGLFLLFGPPHRPKVSLPRDKAILLGRFLLPSVNGLLERLYMSRSLFILTSTHLPTMVPSYSGWLTQLCRVLLDCVVVVALANKGSRKIRIAAHALVSPSLALLSSRRVPPLFRRVSRSIGSSRGPHRCSGGDVAHASAGRRCSGVVRGAREPSREAEERKGRGGGGGGRPRQSRPAKSEQLQLHSTPRTFPGRDRGPRLAGENRLFGAKARKELPTALLGASFLLAPFGRDVRRRIRAHRSLPGALRPGRINGLFEREPGRGWRERVNAVRRCARDAGVAVARRSGGAK